MKGETYQWIPFWVDPWLFGSTRIELEPDERSVWVDFLSIGAKDNGYIRANENTPYPNAQLAGFLCISEELLTRTIKKCSNSTIDKLEQLPNGTLHIKNWEKYQLSNRHKRRVMSAKEDTVSAKEDPIIEDNRREKKRIKKNKQKKGVKKSDNSRHPFSDDSKCYYRLCVRFDRFYKVVKGQPFPGILKEKKYKKIFQSLFKKFDDPFLWTEYSPDQYRHTCEVMRKFFELGPLMGWRLTPENMLSKVDRLQLHVTTGDDGVYDSKKHKAAEEDLIARAIRHLEKQRGGFEAIKYVLKRIPEHQHQQVRIWLDKQFPGGHSYAMVKEELWKERKLEST